MRNLSRFRVSIWAVTGLFTVGIFQAQFASATHEGCTHFTGDSGHQVNGTSGNDHCHGTNQADLMNAGDGADDFSGRDGNGDSINGQNGHDLLNGDDAIDNIVGGAGHDDMRGYNGGDFIFDNADNGDNDRICDGPSGDTVRLNDTDSNDTWYVEGSLEAGDNYQLTSGDTINYGSSCPIPGS